MFSNEICLSGFWWVCYETLQNENLALVVGIRTKCSTQQELEIGQRKNGHFKKISVGIFILDALDTSYISQFFVSNFGIFIPLQSIMPK